MAKTGRKIKYVGDSDERVLLAGEDWGGRLADPLEEGLQWDWSNNHLLTIDISKEALELLLSDPEFVDVTNAKTIPVAAVAARRRAIQSHDPDQEFVDLNAANQGALNPSGVGGVDGSPLSTPSDSPDTGT